MTMILKHETEGIYNGRLVIADNSYLDELESPNTPDEHKKRLKKLIYDKTFRTKFQCKIQGFITENGFENVIVLHLVKNGVEPQMSFNPVEENMTVPKGSRQQKLGCDRASFAIYSDEEYAHINTLADGYYGQSFANANETLLLLSVGTDAMELNEFYENVKFALNLK